MRKFRGFSKKGFSGNNLTISGNFLIPSKFLLLPNFSLIDQFFFSIRKWILKKKRKIFFTKTKFWTWNSSFQFWVRNRVYSSGSIDTIKKRDLIGKWAVNLGHKICTPKKFFGFFMISARIISLFFPKTEIKLRVPK